MEREGEITSSLKCLYCDKVFTRKDNLYRHIRNNHNTAPKLKKESISVTTVRKHLLESTIYMITFVPFVELNQIKVRRTMIVNGVSIHLKDTLNESLC